MIDTVVVGKNYQNIKTGDIYNVLCIAKHSEDPSELLVIYQKKNMLGADFWARPLELFKEKFKEVR